MDDSSSEMAKKSDETFQFSQFAMDNASVDIYWLGCDARIHYVNKQACITLGYSKEELLQLSVPDIDPLFPMEQWSQHWERLKTDRTQTFTTQHRRKNGEIFAVDVIANYVQFGQLEYNVAYARNITEQINREDAIKESERHSKDLISNLQVGVLIQSAHAEIISNNRLALDLLGLTEEQLLGKTSFDPDWNIIHEDGTPFPGFTHPVPLAIETRKSVNNVVMGVYRPSMGDRVWLLVSAAPQLNVDGSVAQVVCTFVDYTERKLAEIELERIRNQLMEAQKIANLGSFEYVVATQTTMWSKEEYRIYGLDPSGPSPTYAELLAKLIHPDDATLLNETFIKALESHSIYEFEHRVVRPDGRVRWVFERALPYFDNDGKSLQRYIGSTLDITDRKLTELSLSEFKSIVNSSDDAIISKTLDGIITNWNHSAEKIFGYTQEEMLGKTMQILMPADRQNEEVDILQKIAQGERIAHFETARRHKDGQLIDISATISPLIDERGRIVGVSKIARDISEQKKQKNLLNAIQEQKIIERERMIAIDKMSSMGTMVGGVAHEINNPLMGVLNYVEYARDKAVDAKSIEVLDNALHEINRIKSIVQNMLVFVRVDDASHVTCSVQGAVKQTVALLEGEFKKHQLQLQIDLPDNLPYIKCSSGSLQQVLVNLLLNARDAVANRDEKRISINVVQQDARVVLSVCDNGTGVEEKIRGKLFEPFFTTKPIGKGTGLGLAVSRQLVEAVGGSLEYDINPEQGVCFKIVFDVA
jgi:PAS domain S-box-containing protein